MGEIAGDKKQFRLRWSLVVRIWDGWVLLLIGLLVEVAVWFPIGDTVTVTQAIIDDGHSVLADEEQNTSFLLRL